MREVGSMDGTISSTGTAPSAGCFVLTAKRTEFKTKSELKLPRKRISINTNRSQKYDFVFIRFCRCFHCNVRSINFGIVSVWIDGYLLSFHATPLPRTLLFEHIRSMIVDFRSHLWINWLVRANIPFTIFFGVANWFYGPTIDCTSRRCCSAVANGRPISLDFQTRRYEWSNDWWIMLKVHVFNWFLFFSLANELV